MTEYEANRQYMREYLQKEHHLTDIQLQGVFPCLNPHCKSHATGLETMTYDAEARLCKCLQTGCSAEYDLFTLYGIDHNTTNYRAQREGVRRYFGINEEIKGAGKRNGTQGDPGRAFDYLATFGISREIAERHGAAIFEGVRKNTETDRGQV